MDFIRLCKNGHEAADRCFIQAAREAHRREPELSRVYGTMGRGDLNRPRA